MVDDTMAAGGDGGSGDGIALTSQQAISVLDEARSHKDNAARILEDIQNEQAAMLGGAWEGTSAGSYRTTSLTQHEATSDIIRKLEGLIAMGEDAVKGLGNSDGGDGAIL